MIETILAWFRPHTRKGQIIFAIGFILIFGPLLGRMGLLGEFAYERTKVFFNFYMPFIDTPSSAIYLNFNFFVQSNDIWKPGSSGETYYSGDFIHFTLESNVKCWLTVFSVDVNGIHEVGRETNEPRFFEPGGQPEQIPIQLDNTVGPEVYYAVASKERFDFEKDILPHIPHIGQRRGAKGPVMPPYRLKLGDKYYHSLIHFNHK